MRPSGSSSNSAPVACRPAWRPRRPRGRVNRDRRFHRRPAIAKEIVMSEWSLDQTYLYQGQAVRYAVTGDGPPLVLVHGTPFSSYVWHRVVPYLAEHRRLFFYDLLGYGESEQRDGQDVSLGVQNEVLVE